jgi:thiamine biosynthesis protein ThiS
MKVYIEKTGKTVSVTAKDVKELLSKLKINPTTVLVTRNNEIIIESEKLKSTDKIKILSVISGG